MEKFVSETITFGQVENNSLKPDLFEWHKELFQNRKERFGIPTGFEDLDMLLGGFQPSTYMILVASPSAGKTSFALNLALHASEKDVCLYFIMEMSKQQLLKRAISVAADFDTSNRIEHYTLKEKLQLTDAFQRLAHSNLHIFDSCKMNTSYIHSKIKEMRMRYGEEKRILVVIDYLQLLVGHSSIQNLNQELDKISIELKKVAHETSVTILALSSLKRPAKGTSHTLSELNDYEQHADIVGLLTSDRWSICKEAELTITKHRNGNVGVLLFVFNKASGKFISSTMLSKV
ncbi:MAG TPA: DnaB-like helicase C-terminal domain-containing protein [Pseudoneobacillus sp.]|nr:DnaB-like helicase C-terminal domain-containing protein [Pseudoneobacillus sp.]